VNESAKAVFLSYASEDAEAARRLYAALRRGGVEVWFDRSELRGGDAWDQQIRQRIRDCSLFIPIVSANTQARQEGYFRLEWRLADQRTHLMARNKVFIVPVAIDRTSDAGADVPESFAAAQWTHLPGGETPSTFVERIVRLLSPVTQTSTRPTLPARDSSPHTVQSVTLAQGAIPEKSIAVLPFVDMSATRDQEYFADGLTEALIDLMTQVRDLRVPARTSSFYFKNKPEKLAVIARELGVAHVLEGSVRIAGRRIRVTTHLIRTDTGYHLWSNKYDRDLEDVFKVQDEIAEAVVRALKATLLDGPPAGRSTPTSMDAHNLYLQGRYFAGRRSVVDMITAIDYFEQAIQSDSSYAAAWAALGHACAWIAQFGNEDVAATSEKARRAAQAAIRLDAHLPEGHTTLALINASYDFDWAGARSELDRALTADPRNPEALLYAGQIHFTFGDTDRAIQHYRDVLDVDPLRADGYLLLGNALYSARRFDEAAATLRSALKLNPGQVKLRFQLGLVELSQGHPAEARTMIEGEAAPWYRLAGLAIVDDANGRRADADSALTDLCRDYAASAAIQIAEVFGHRADRDAAFEWLERAYAQRDAGLRWLKVDPLFDGLRGDPRYEALLRRMNLSV
jgi:TolB-like protein/tetratricopeptide (TPR) repeat protein